MNEKNVSLFFVLTVLLVYPLPQIAIDMYLPSMPAMVSAFKTNQTLVQQSLTIYLLFLGISQLIYGPLSDVFGRKIILCIGSFIFLIGSIWAMFCTTILWFVFSRALQGLGMGCGFAVASAILSDVFSGVRLAKMTAYSAMIYCLSTIFAPVLGGYLHVAFGWQANFFVMFLYTLMLMAFIRFALFETNVPNKEISCSKITKSYFAMLGNLKFMGNVCCLTFVFGIMVAFNVVGPFLLQNVLGINAIHYGKLLMLVGMSYFVGSTVNSKLLNMFTQNAMIYTGLLIITCFSIILYIIGIFGWFTVSSVIFFTCLVMFGIGMVFSNCFANALSVFPSSGITGAFIGAGGLIGTSIISTIVTHIRVTNEIELAEVYGSLAVLSFLSYLGTRKVKTIADNLDLENIKV